MTRAAVEAIIEQYKQHGWSLRRVLLSPSLRESMNSDGNDLFGAAELVSSDLDAAWFSRASRPGRETWELRLLGPTPYALDAFLAEDSSAAEHDEILRNTEERMREAAPHHRDN